MSNLKIMKSDLAKLQKEIEKKQLKIAQEQAKPKAEIITKALLNNKEICEKLNTYSRDEIKIISACIVKNFNGIVKLCSSEIEAQKQAKKQRAEQKNRTQNSAQNVATNSGQQTAQTYNNNANYYSNNNNGGTPYNG